MSRRLRSHARAMRVAGLALLLSAAPAHADLLDDGARVAKLWSASGARVERLPTVFLEHGHPQRVALPLATIGGSRASCVTVALLTVRTAEITARAAGAELTGSVSTPHEAQRSEPSVAAALAGDTSRLDDGDTRQRSAGGVTVLAKCGEGSSDLARIVLEITSGRAAVEVVLARSEEPLAHVVELLPERAAGPGAPRGETGGPLEPGPLSLRVARAERRARQDGAAAVERTTVRALATGAGQAELRLAEGCHRIDVMADVPSTLPRRGTDVDAEVRDASGRLLARDAADVPDARLDFCLGEPTRVTVPFVGAAGALPVALSAARWPLPARIPVRWGPRARAGFAAALRRRHAPDPRAEPIFESLGVQGQTAIPLEVERGRCYLAALAPLRGEARLLRLSAAVGDRVLRDDAMDRPEGVAVTFCAEATTVARFDAEVRGNFAWWALVVWPMGSAAP